MSVERARSEPVVGLRQQPIVVVFGTVLAGVTYDRFVGPPLRMWWILALSGLVSWTWFGRQKMLRTCGCCLLVAVAGVAGLWHHARWRLFPADELSFSVKADAIPVCVEATALSSPRRKPAPPPNVMDTIHHGDETHFAVEIRRVRDGRRWRAASGRTVVRAGGTLTGIHAGDRLRIFALLSAPGTPLNPGEPDFALIERSERRLCHLNVDSPAGIRVVERGSRIALAYWLNAVRDHWDANLWRHVSHSRAGLAAAVLLGAREQVDRDRNADFMATGTVHLLSISGLHVGILAYGFWLLARLGWLSRKMTFVAAIGFVTLYAMLTEARPPVVRASVLVSVMCIARLLGRQAFSFNTLAAAGLLVLVFNPTSFFQAGTQLSFLAVATMACLPAEGKASYAGDPLTRLIAETRPWPIRVGRRLRTKILQAVWLSTSIWLTALPLVVYRFHLVSLVATILNPIVCLPMAVALFAGFGVMLLGGIAPPLADACGWMCDRSLGMMEACIAWALTWPGTHLWLPSPPVWWVILFYGVVVPAAYGTPVRLPQRWMTALGCTWFAVGAWLTMGPGARPTWREAPEFSCSLIAVGHGTSVLLEFPNGQTLLYDAGRLGTAAAGTRSISSVLWSRGITHLDALIISHADADHYNAIPDLVDRFSVAVVYVSPRMFAHRSAALQVLRQSIESRGIPIRLLFANRAWRSADGMKLSVLHPPAQGVQGSDNANSIVLLAEFAGYRVLLPGDLETPGLEDLLARPVLDCDVIMAPHHGSPRSNPGGFAAWSTPEYVVISGSLARDATAVKRAYQAVGAHVLHTAEDGMVQFRFRTGIRTGSGRGTSFRNAIRRSRQ